MITLFGDTSGAVISPCGMYRYSLTRQWDAGKPMACFVMLNPSTADADADDPTLRRCRGFAQSWGYGGLEVVNLFAFRATDPNRLKSVSDPTGPNNDAHIQHAVQRASRVIVAWGTRGSYLRRDAEVLRLIAEPYCLARTGSGYPQHPLYLSSSCRPEVYVP